MISNWIRRASVALSFLALNVSLFAAPRATCPEWLRLIKPKLTKGAYDLLLERSRAHVELVVQVDPAKLGATPAQRLRFIETEASQIGLKLIWLKDGMARLEGERSHFGRMIEKDYILKAALRMSVPSNSKPSRPAPRPPKSVDLAEIFSDSLYALPMSKLIGELNTTGFPDQERSIYAVLNAQEGQDPLNELQKYFGEKSAAPWTHLLMLSERDDLPMAIVIIRASQSRLKSIAASLKESPLVWIADQPPAFSDFIFDPTDPKDTPAKGRSPALSQSERALLARKALEVYVQRLSDEKKAPPGATVTMNDKDSVLVKGVAEADRMTWNLPKEIEGIRISYEF